MKWRGRRGSSNIEDRRGRSGGKLAVGGGLGGIVVLVLYLLLGGDPEPITQNKTPAIYEPTTEESALADMVSVVLADTEEVWGSIFAKRNQRYIEPTLVYFTDRVQSACGMAGAATGPFYCPADEKIYIDLSFYRQMKEDLNAPGDFAMAYVVAHEVGHHVQNLLGITEQVHNNRRQLSQTDYNQLSVRLELQADFLAGLWAHHAQSEFGILEAGDIDEALNAAHAIGDDRLQKQSQGYVVPDAFTHGTSTQRVKWFRKGFTSGRLEDGDTFTATDL